MGGAFIVSPPFPTPSRPLPPPAELAKFALAALKERNGERAARFLADALNALAPGTVR